MYWFRWDNTDTQSPTKQQTMRSANDGIALRLQLTHHMAADASLSMFNSSAMCPFRNASDNTGLETRAARTSMLE